MLGESYGGFTPTLPAIDIRLGSAEHFDHFHLAWSGLGRRQLLPRDATNRFALMSIGTVVEHELRHFHDYLLNRDLLLTSWLRRRMSINAMPVISRILRSSDLDLIPFPLLDWAGLSGPKRKTLQDELRSMYPKNQQRFWSPRTIRRRAQVPRSRVMRRSESAAEAAEQERLVLEGVRADREAIAPLRHGPDPTPLDQYRFTPRFAFEFSALNAQLQAIFQTYGINEGFEFAAGLSEDGSMFARFFTGMLEFFGSRGGSSAFEGENVDFPAMNAVAFWIMCGCSADGLKGSPSTRLSTLIEAARDGWDDVFPAGAGPVDLLRRFDHKVGVLPYVESLEATQEELDGHVQAARQFYAIDPAQAGSQLRSVDAFATVLGCRRDLVSRVLSDPSGYLDPLRWMKDLTVWPQCPVHLRFIDSRLGVAKERFEAYPPGTMFNVTTNLSDDKADEWVGDVFMESFFPSRSRLDLKPVVDHFHIASLFDVLVEPEQVSARDENKIRHFVRERYGKELVRVFL
ncbi:hypothetical protein LJR090_001794 [Bosea sp. LjRoot90]|uniref:hypothetical protein n=1 Tax=Bosea sp. LjRoot90 TaxID=3342342 RepID=UPI003ED1581D